MFKQEKKHIVDFMIEFEVLAIKADIDDLHAIFLLKKNVQMDIIKTILGYLPIVVSETLKEWKVAIISVRQEYKSTKEQQDYRIALGITYGGQGIPIDMGKANDNFDKNGKLKCFNCNIYGHMVKNCKKPKKE